MQTISPNIILVLLLILLGVSGFCVWQIVAFKKMKDTFFAGQKAGNLENVILAIKDQLNQTIIQQSLLEEALINLNKKSDLAIQNVGLIRFNPFKGSGGNFSFSIALLDKHGSGIILTSMYGREQNRIYTKKMLNGKCETQLTEEEEEAINLANSNNILQ